VIKINLTNILLAVTIGLVVWMLFTNNKQSDLIDVNLEQNEEIIELRNFQTELLTEVHELKAEKLQKDELEHEVKMFYDSSYVDVNTPNGVKDSILTDFFRQYDMLVGQRLREGGERTDTITGT
jgi:hypothetical protein